VASQGALPYVLFLHVSWLHPYCTKREIQDAKDVTTANGRSALQGTCPVCGTKLTRFVAGPAKAAAGH